MKILALAMLLAIMQAAPPVPRKAADSPTSASKKVQNDTSHEQNNASQFEATNANTPKATDHQNAINGQRHEDADRPIAIRELPTVTVNSRRDWADWGTWIFSFLLMVVGALQVLLLRWTLRVIRRQAKEMIRQRILMRKQWGEMSAQTASLKEYVEETKKIARSTADNVQIIINKERARIRVEVSGDPKLFPHDAVGHINELAYTIFCDGSTPAFITKSWANLKVTDSKNPSSPFPNIPMSIPAVLHPSV